MPVAAVIGLLAQTEQLVIALTVHGRQTDMPSWWHMRRAVSLAHKPVTR